MDGSKSGGFSLIIMIHEINWPDTKIGLEPFFMPTLA